MTISAAGLVQSAWAQAVVAYLVLVNVAVGIFNLVPGFPLDGGRLLRAALWTWKGTLGQATYIASRVGVAFAFADLRRRGPRRLLVDHHRHVPQGRRGRELCADGVAGSPGPTTGAGTS